MDFPQIIIPNGKAPNIEDSALQFSFEPDDFQKHSFLAIENGHDVLVCAPTASGKTLVAQYAIAHTIKKGLKVMQVNCETNNIDEINSDTELNEQQNTQSNLQVNNRVVYATPIKVLSNQNYSDLKPIFNPMGVSVGISTGDIKIDEDSHCLVATAEILRNSMYQLNQTVDNSRKKIDKDFVDSIGCIIVDEAHYMNDKDRGRVWEEIIILAKPNVLMVFLSATLSNPEKFASWISKCRERPISLITVEQRKVPLKHYLLINNSGTDALDSSKQLYQFMNEKNVYDPQQFKNALNAHNKWKKERQKKGKLTNNPNDIPSTVKWLKDNDLLQAIFFAFSKKECEFLANTIEFDLIGHDEKHKIEVLFNKHMQPHLKKYENVGQINVIKNLLLKGVAYHHSGMLSILKEIVEIIFKEGLAKVLFCTETFAVGINCPTRTVVFTSIDKYTDGGKRLLEPAEYKQMAGRAGRRGLDSFGNVIILFRNEFPDEEDIKKITCGKVPEITSNFKWDYQFFLKIVQSNVTDIERFFSKSLMNLENELILNGLKKERDIITTKLKSMSACNSEYSKDINTLIAYEKQLSSEMFGVGVKINLPKKQQTEFQKLKKMLSNSNFKTAYDEKQNIAKLENTLKQIEKQIFSYETYVANFCSKLRAILFKWGYITANDSTELNYSHINVKGVIAGNINECNPIILTEMICEGYFDGLSIEEIIAFVSIFTEPIKSAAKFEQNQVTSFNGTLQLKDKIKKLLDMITLKQLDEDDEFGVGFKITDWSISTDYIDIAYMWAKGESVKTTLEHLYDLDEYDGNFVKNMLKVCNIINDIQCVCKMIGKVDLLPILENADSLILRDIVTVTSLYLK